MAKKESKRVMEQRKRDYDRISFTIPKEARHLLRVQALREGVSSAEMIRRAILARCGLESWPDFSMPHYHTLTAAENKEDAERAINGLQLDEYVHHHQNTTAPDDLYMTIMLSSQGMKDEYIKALLDLLDALEDIDAPWAAGWTPPTQIKITQAALSIVRRLLSNIDVVSPYDGEDETDDKL